jgi:hypothetical protein
MQVIFAGTPRAVLRQAEALLLRRREQAPDTHGAVADALAQLGDASATMPAAQRAARGIADAVLRHAAGFAPEPEPAYHDVAHQAEATLAMGWLCAAARARGLLTARQTVAGVLAMAGHDLLHPGLPAAPGVLEARSADLSVAIAAEAGLDAGVCDDIRRVILATDPLRPPEQRAGDDLLARLGQEADLFGSLTPGLGWRLSAALAREWAAAGLRGDPAVDSYAGRLRWLRGLRRATEPGRVFGLDVAVADQIAATEACGGGDAAAGAARLDAMAPAAARALWRTALAEVGAP